MPRICIAIVGPGERAPASAIEDAREIGRLVAERGWVVLTGGRDAGVMRAATDGAASVGGLTTGILPGPDKTGAAPTLTIALATGLGEARNAVLVTAADAVVACGMNPGTASEVALALRAGKPTVLVRPDGEAAAFFEGFHVHVAATPRKAMDWLAERLQ